LDTFEPFGDRDYAWFATKVEARFKVRLGDYKPDQMRRRLASLATRTDSSSFAGYYNLLESQRDKLSQFLDEMTINVTELLRNPNLFETLMTSLIPGRFPVSGQFRMWSAGCSYGAEAYTLAMLFHERSPMSQFSVRGTDVDFTVLARANSPTFSKEDMVNISTERRERHFLSPDGVSFVPQNHLKSHVEFGHHDLLGGSYPTSQYDLILCRNVLIYFNDEARERIYANLSRALKPGGILFVGGSERLSDHQAAGLSFLKPFFYEKPVVQSLAA
jgi:chemotaxis protein methyltransferase CheR